jgi:hypothetical protein
MSDEPQNQPSEIGELRVVATEYLDRRKNIENEIETLKEDLKALKDEFADRVDMRTLEAVIKVMKIEQAVLHKHTYDLLSEALKSEE